ncbi:hypothetical protein BDV38DRAFT_248662 [Aspergillus pseudotamarii]|uniref:Uncharacterized protein n=1 Tax=Aspergillus pseudotamarii TaxID=132259 RepID=A0A5N6SSY4_ASPPS|nr:uncharacterized protein BDV38DRAFT_248662 [Aspergillus pseudotamarii]KAE8136901.1 hypothetical protein BDV38DRAFT_248662 [Aspergillus pseudotamarii]
MHIILILQYTIDHTWSRINTLLAIPPSRSCRLWNQGRLWEGMFHGWGKWGAGVG